jgi:hypothetical protein
MITIYDHQNIFIVQATGRGKSVSVLVGGEGMWHLQKWLCWGQNTVGLGTDNPARINKGIR